MVNLLNIVITCDRFYDCKNVFCFTKNSWTPTFLFPLQYYSQYELLNALGSRKHINFLELCTHST